MKGNIPWRLKKGFQVSKRHAPFLGCLIGYYTSFCAPLNPISGTICNPQVFNSKLRYSCAIFMLPGFFQKCKETPDHLVILKLRKWAKKSFICLGFLAPLKLITSFSVEYFEEEPEPDELCSSLRFHQRRGKIKMSCSLYSNNQNSEVQLTHKVQSRFALAFRLISLLSVILSHFLWKSSWLWCRCLSAICQSLSNNCSSILCTSARSKRLADLQDN